MDIDMLFIMDSRKLMVSLSSFLSVVKKSSVYVIYSRKVNCLKLKGEPFIVEK